MQDDEAVVTMVDSNLQREQITPSEKAYAYKMKYDAIKKKAGRKNIIIVLHSTLAPKVKVLFFYRKRRNEKLDFYVMEASDEEFDTEEVRKLVKRLDELDPIPLPWKSDEEALKDFWDYCEERQREERIIAEMKIKG